MAGVRSSCFSNLLSAREIAGDDDGCVIDAFDVACAAASRWEERDTLPPASGAVTIPTPPPSVDDDDDGVGR